jgi:choline-sulfatase
MSRTKLFRLRLWLWAVWFSTLFPLYTSFALSSEGRPPTPVILISMDTLRADHLSCYGSRLVRTPNIDAIGKGGTTFTQIGAQVPLTFPSHVSLLTSTYPYTQGVEDNSEFLPPNSVTLARLLQSRGYRTAAFIGGFVLDARFGLDQGFDSYDSPFNLSHQKGVDPSDLKRFGDEVVEAAEQWLEKHSDDNFFLFLHLYDLHTPYTLPPAARPRFKGRGYDTQLRYIDETLGRFWVALRRMGILDRAIIVFLSDHGEGLGEHGEATHGYFIYQSTLRVPLIIHWPVGTGPFPAVISEPASLLDVAPTILQFLGIPTPPQFQGRSLLQLFDAKTRENPRAVYGESFYAHNHYKCSPVRSVRLSRYKYIEAPKPELYDIDHDPSETSNLYDTQRSIALSLRDRLHALQGGSSIPRPSRAPSLSQETVERLAALGYLAETNLDHYESKSEADPKDRIAEYRQVHRAITLAYSGRLRESVAMIEQVLAKTPQLSDARNILALFQQRLGQHDKAARNFRLVLVDNPSNILAHYNLGLSYFNLQRPGDAVKELDAVLSIASNSGHAFDHLTTPTEELLGTIWMQQKEYQRARDRFEHLLTVVPDNFLAHYSLSWTAALEGRFDEALRHIQIALKVEPRNAEAHNVLGTLYLQKEDLPSARDQFAEATRIAPNFANAHYNLAIVLTKQNAQAEAAGEFKEALRADPRHRLAREALEQLQHEEDRHLP